MVFFPPCENTRRSQLSATWKRVLTRTWPCWHPDLRLPAARTVRNKFLFVPKPPSLWYFVIAAQTDLRQSYSQLIIMPSSHLISDPPVFSLLCSPVYKNTGIFRTFSSRQNLLSMHFKQPPSFHRCQLPVPACVSQKDLQQKLFSWVPNYLK